VVSGQEYHALINDVTDYVLEDFKKQGHHFERHEVHSWVFFRSPFVNYVRCFWQREGQGEGQGKG